MKRAKIYTLSAALCLLNTSMAQDVSFRSSDKKLESTFGWAKEMALSYAHHEGDAVGPWYEAALPGRDAFCMRDASHQSIPAEMLGLSRHNFNMMKRFAMYMDAGRDYCTFWEINKMGKACPNDYKDDTNFWYNLNGNFDVLYACWRLYEWTGDKRYLKDQELAKFYKTSVNEYAERWQLGPNQILARPLNLNNKPETTGRYRFTRGLPSYVENRAGLNASSDLVATAYAGYKAYADMMKAVGQEKDGKAYRNTAEKYRALLENEWWNEADNTYYALHSAKGEFIKRGEQTYILWFGIAQNKERISKTAKQMMASKQWNAENISYFPTLWCRYGYADEAYKVLTAVPSMHRKEYPEVSYGMIEGIVSGTMGIMPSASENRVTTLPQLPAGDEWAELKNLKMLGGSVDVKHEGNKKSSFTNHTESILEWKAAFHGEEGIRVAGKKKRHKTDTDVMGKSVSYVIVKVKPGTTATAVMGD